MKILDTFIITEAGEKTNGPVFGPLFRTVQPALQRKADLIRIVTKGMDVSAEFVANGKSTPLKVQKDYHPAVTSTRIRIASGMSIVPQGLQTGTMGIDYGGEYADVDVEIRFAAKQEAISMRLSWKASE